MARAFVGLDDDAAHALDHRAVMHRAVDLGDDGLIARVAGFEELDDARQTAGDVLGLGRGARDLGENVARVDLLAVLHHDVGAGREQVTLLLALLRFDGDGRRALLGGGRLDDDHLREAGDAVGLFADVLAFDDVLERDLAADLGENGRGERIPLDERLAGVDVLAVVHLQRRAVDERVTLLLAAASCRASAASPFFGLLDRGVVHDQQLAVTVDDDEIAVLVRDGGDVDELDAAGVRRFVLRLLGNARCRTADVEGTHGELRARLADRLGGDDADRFADLDQLAAGQVAAVAAAADAAARFAGQHRSGS